MEKRSFVAFALALGVLALYPMLLQKFYPDAYKRPAVTRTAASETAPAATAPAAGTAALPSAAVLKDPGSAPALDPREDAVFTNAKLRVAFNATGGAVREIDFLAFKDPENPLLPIRFFSLTTPAGAPLAVDVIGAGGAATAYALERDASGVTAAATAGAFKITKRVAFRDGYAADARIEFQNVSAAPAELRYRLDVGSRIPPRGSIDGQYIEANFFSTVDGKKTLRHVKEHKLGKAVESGSAVEWVAVKDRHFSVVVKPVSPVAYTGLVQGLGHDHFAASLVSSPVTVPAGGTVSHDFLFYAGPNDIDALQPVGLGEIVNFGKLDMIAKLLVGSLEMLRGVFRNYGLAIIALTVLINILLFPFTRVSYMSMKRMQLVQPQMNKLREQHKKNPERLNREMMELYKKHKVNPFGGCLPMLLQMPVFIALYVALSKTVGLRNSSFLWVTDLSSPDNVYLPFALPFLGKTLHVLPLIMVAGMALQQRLTTIKIEGQDPNIEAQQKMMAWMMPLLFGFIFYTMPSGLVLYWLTNTVLMTAYQLRLKRVTLT